jgi:hypothetical protein
MEAEAFKILEENFSEEWRNEAYAHVLMQIGRFIEKYNLRSSNFPKRANTAMYVLALGLAKKGLVFKPDEAESYLISQLERIRDGGYEIIAEIYQEIVESK